MNPDAVVLPGTVINGADGKLYVYSGVTWKPVTFDETGKFRGDSLNKPAMTQAEFEAVMDAMKPTPEQIAKTMENLKVIAEQAEEERERIRLRDELKRVQSG